ncbi:hypothetical protein BHF71_04860 [Vulcanibacillus modesticaldus]|uniref:CNNM transmembrane domain-containing protein n=1 Tax=Vulcanibacillus modesticaldus TaxID=337097 RepID=A0A1D2YRU5_9BACI|nr:hypothetical protein [Vulcanibacillus modesticaldus]OEF95524.1 hypothetical protein BHF71_04860 [Vulcanibacillus modesticaldus]
MKLGLNDSLKWSLFISVVTLILSIIFTVVSTSILAGVSWAIGMIVVFIIIIIGVFFDMLGLAAASANEKPFHSMASERLNGAKQAIKIVRNADKFSNFCNDVIGDISGIVSGTATAIVVIQLVYSFGETENSNLYTILSVLFTSIVAALTVGGKAVGKTIAINNSTKIILYVGKFFSFLEKNFNMTIYNGNKKMKRKAGGKNGAK